MKHNYCNMDISFSQVREDPLIELEVVKYLQANDEKKSDKKLNVLMITSGGCTLLSLLSDKINVIDAIDVNMQQNYLAELKVAMVILISSKELLLDTLEGNSEKKSCDIILKYAQKLLSTECYDFWMKNIDIVYSGINNVGKFEKLFKSLADSKFDYVKWFNRDNLSNIFGSSAVINSLNKEFFDHFKNVVDYYRLLYKPDDNYFYHQILYGKYSKKSLPPYFDLNTTVIFDNYKKINYICSEFGSYIQSCKSYYDIIQTSNIFDWCNKDVIDQLLSLVFNRLNPNGIIIARRLNGDYNLKDMVSKYFKIIDIKIVDKSHFYSEVVIGQKIA